MAELQPTTVDGTLNSLRSENVQTSSYTLSINDRDRVVAMNNTSNVTVTVPNDSAVNFPIGSIVYINRINSGSVTLAAASGVTLGRTGNLASFEEIYVRKRDDNFWMVIDVTRAPTVTGGTESDSGGFKINTFTSSGTLSIE